jgi:hypothetical protein
MKLLLAVSLRSSRCAGRAVEEHFMEDAEAFTFVAASADKPVTLSP